MVWEIQSGGVYFFWNNPMQAQYVRTRKVNLCKETKQFSPVFSGNVNFTP